MKTRPSPKIAYYTSSHNIGECRGTSNGKLLLAIVSYLSFHVSLEGPCGVSISRITYYILITFLSAGSRTSSEWTLGGLPLDKLCTRAVRNDEKLQIQEQRQVCVGGFTPPSLAVSRIQISIMKFNAVSESPFPDPSSMSIGNRIVTDDA